MSLRFVPAVGLGVVVAALLTPILAWAQETRPADAPTGVTLDLSLPPDANYETAEFRFWLPADSPPVRGVVVLVPGSNGDGRPMAADPFWQQFAVKERLALVACRFRDKRHDQAFIEDYVDVSRGSGQALLDALSMFAERSGHGEVAHAPLLMWGMSAGGQFNYEFVAWKPERVAAFIVNKGGIYYHALLPKAARDVPGFLFVGEKDLQSRIDTITGLFAVNRRGGAVWALVVEPGAGHVVGHSRELGALLFEEALKLRLGGGVGLGAGPVVMGSVAAASGFVGHLTNGSFEPAAGPGTPGVPDAWLLTERLAKAWQAVITGR